MGFLGRLAAVTGCVLLLLAAPVAAQQKVTIKFIHSTPPTTYFLPYLVPVDQGWYEQNGLHIEEVIVNGGATALRTFLSSNDELTMTSVGPSIIFNAIIQGAKIKSIGSWQPTVDYHIVAAKSVGTTLKDLQGKIFASADSSDNTAALPPMILKKHGIDTSGIRFVQVGGHPQRLQAVEAGKAQATIINTLTTLVGQSHGAINVVGKVAEDFPSIAYITTVAKDSDLADPAKRRALEIFLKGNIIGARYVMDHPDEAAALLQKRVPDLDPSLVKEVVRQLNAQNIWGVNGGNSAEVYRFSSEIAKQLGVIEREVAVPEIMDNSLADKIVAEIGKR